MNETIDQKELERLQQAITKPLEAFGIRPQIKPHQAYLNLILNHPPDQSVNYGAIAQMMLVILENFQFVGITHLRIVGRILGEDKARWQQLYPMPEPSIPESHPVPQQPSPLEPSLPERQFVGRPGFYWNFLGNGYSIPALGTMILFIKDEVLIARRKGFLESNEIWMPLSTINSLEFYQTPMYLFSYLGFICIIGTVFVRSLILLAPILILVAFLFRSKHIIVKNYTNTIIFFGADVQDYQEIIRRLKLVEHPTIEEI